MARRIFLFLLIVIFFAVFLAFVGQVIFEKSYKFPAKISFGVTFSPKFARYLQLDWKKTYIQVLDELQVKSLRLPVYWDDLEKQEGKFDFEDEDFMVKEAAIRHAKIILVVGAKQPRWPECHVPAWAKVLSLQERRSKILKTIQKVVLQYRDQEAVWAWQVENEPFLPFFGENCDQGDENFLATEVNIVKALSQKPIIISDSGELGSWIAPMKLSDIFGTTLYRDVYNPVMGYFSYPILPYLYNIKSQVARIFAPHNKKTIIIELQTEPWLADSKYQGKAVEQAKLFPPDKFKSYVKYAQKTGFDEMYLWGVEWWFWMAQNGYPEYLNYAKTLFK